MGWISLVNLASVRDLEARTGTVVDPGTGGRDLPVVSMIHRTYGHQFMGTYLEIRTAGVVAKGDELVV